MLVVAERGTGLGFDQPEDEQRDPDDAEERVDAVVVVQEDRADLQGLLHVAVAAFDDLLVFVEPQDLAGGDPAGEVRRERVDPVERCGRVDRVLVALPGECQLVVAGGDGHVDQAGDVGAEDLPDPTFDLFAGLVVAAAQSVAHPLERVLGLLTAHVRGRQRPGWPPRRSGCTPPAASAAGGVSVAGDLPVAQRALEHGSAAAAGASPRARAGSGPDATRAWPTSARNRSRNPALARNGTTNRTPAWSISRIVLGCPIAESHTINRPGPEISSSRSRTRRPTSTPPRSPDPGGCRAPSRPALTACNVRTWRATRRSDAHPFATSAECS